MEDKLKEILEWFKGQHYFKKKYVEKLELLNELARRMAECLSIKINKVKFEIINPELDSGSSYWNNIENIIVLHNRLSLITFFHEFGHALKLGEKQAQNYAIDTFKYLYPHSFLKLKQKENSYMMIK